LDPVWARGLEQQPVSWEVFLDPDVGGDGFDGGLGSLEKVEEADELQEDETSDDVEAEEEIALLTVPGKE